jgi:hypothetical protein
MRDNAMPNEPNDPRSLWQNQEVEKVTITIDEVRRRSECFERRVYWRNVREYVAGAAGIAWLLTIVWLEHGRLLLPSLILVAGTVYVMVQLHRRSARTLPSNAGLRSALEFHRMELERQRDALRSVWRWYLLPFVPGLLAVLVGAGLDRGFSPRLLIIAVALALMLIGVWRLNQWGARKLERRIEKIRAMEANHE